MCDGCDTPGNVHAGETFQPPARDHFEHQGLSGGVKIPLKDRGSSELVREMRVSDMLTPDALMNPQAFPAEAAGFVMVMNMLTRVQLELSAIRHALERRGLLTEQEFMQSLSEVNKVYDAAIRQGQGQMMSRPAGPPRPAAPHGNDPRMSPR